MTKLAKNSKHVQQFLKQKFESRERCKGVHCVDLGESFQTHIFLQNFVSIEPRTSPVKFADFRRHKAGAMVRAQEERRGARPRPRRGERAGRALEAAVTTRSCAKSANFEGADVRPFLQVTRRNASTDSGCVRMRRDASRMRPDASGCVGILNSSKLHKIPAIFCNVTYSNFLLHYSHSILANFGEFCENFGNFWGNI